MNRADHATTRWDLALSWGIPGPLAVDLLSEERPDRPIILPRHDLAAFACELHCLDFSEALARDNVILTATLLEFRWGMRKLLIMDDRIRRLSSPTMFQLDPVLGVELHGVQHREPDPTGTCLLYTSPSPRDATLSRMPSSA